MVMLNKKIKTLNKSLFTGRISYIDNSHAAAMGVL